MSLARICRCSALVLLLSLVTGLADGWPDDLYTNSYAELTRHIVLAYNERAKASGAAELPDDPSEFDYAIPPVFADTREAIRTIIPMFHGAPSYDMVANGGFDQYNAPGITVAEPVVPLTEIALVRSLGIGTNALENVIRVNTNVFTVPFAARNYIGYPATFAVRSEPYTHKPFFELGQSKPSHMAYDPDPIAAFYEYWKPGWIWWFGSEDILVTGEVVTTHYDIYPDTITVPSWNCMPVCQYRTTLASFYYLPTNEVTLTCMGFSSIYWPAVPKNNEPPVFRKYTWLPKLNGKDVERQYSGTNVYYATSANPSCYFLPWAGGWLIATNLDVGLAASATWSPIYQTSPVGAVTALHSLGFPTKVRDNDLGYPSVGPSGHYYPGGVLYPKEYDVALNFVDGLSHWGDKKNSLYQGAVDTLYNLNTMPQSALYSAGKTELHATNTVGGDLQVPDHTLTVTGQVMRISGLYILVGDAWWDRQHSNELTGICDLGASAAIDVNSAIAAKTVLAEHWFDVENSYNSTNYYVSRSNLFGTVTSYVWAATNVWKLPAGRYTNSYWTATNKTTAGITKPVLIKKSYIHTSVGPGALALSYSLVNSNSFAIRERDAAWYTGYEIGVDGWFTRDTIWSRYRLLNALEETLAQIDMSGCETTYEKLGGGSSDYYVGSKVSHYTEYQYYSVGGLWQWRLVDESNDTSSVSFSLDRTGDWYDEYGEYIILETFTEPGSPVYSVGDPYVDKAVAGYWSSVEWGDDKGLGVRQWSFGRFEHELGSWNDLPKYPLIAAPGTESRYSMPVIGYSFTDYPADDDPAYDSAKDSVSELIVDCGGYCRLPSDNDPLDTSAAIAVWPVKTSGVEIQTSSSDLAGSIRVYTMLNMAGDSVQVPKPFQAWTHGDDLVPSVINPGSWTANVKVSQTPPSPSTHILKEKNISEYYYWTNTWASRQLPFDAYVSDVELATASFRQGYSSHNGLYGWPAHLQEAPPRRWTYTYGGRKSAGSAVETLTITNNLEFKTVGLEGYFGAPMSTVHLRFEVDVGASGSTYANNSSLAFQDSSIYLEAHDREMAVSILYPYQYTLDDIRATFVPDFVYHD